MGTTKITKQAAIMASGKALFWKHGFRRVSIEEICAKAGVSKMTYYRFFGNKTELAKAVFDQVVAEGRAQFRAIMQDDGTPSEEKIRKMLLLKHEGTNDISREFLNDFYTDRESELRAYVEAKTTESWQTIVKDFEAAQQKGIFRKDFKPEFILILSRKLTEFLNDPAALALYDNPQDLIMEVTNLVMYGISPHP